MTQPTIPPHLAPLFAEFEQQGEVVVQHAILSGDYANSSTRQPAAMAWLKFKEEQRRSSEATTRDKREEETLAIARSAAETAKEALRVAKHERTTAIVAAVVALVAAFAAVIPLAIQYFQKKP